MSLRSKVVIENNLKPSKFGKPASASAEKHDDDFEEIYENPLEKSKPLPPGLDELPRNEPAETMEFSNGSKNVGNLNNVGADLITSMSRNRIGAGADNEKILTPQDRPTTTRNRYNINVQRNSKDSTSPSSGRGVTNEGFDDPSLMPNSNSSNSTTSGNHNVQPSGKLVADDSSPATASAAIPSSDNEKNDRSIEDNPDISFMGVVNAVRFTIKSLDVNRYATKKTIAQGMLDIALLTANASQLKYILQIGKQHEFYILMLSLICVSIGLQIFSGLLSLTLNLMRDCRMEDNAYAKSVEWIGRARVTLSFFVFLDNLFIATFDPTGLNAILTSEAAGVICVLLGSSLNINKQQDQKKANVWNNICLILMVLTVAVNAVISAFDMRDNSTLTQGNATRGAASTQLQASGGR